MSEPALRTLPLMRYHRLLPGSVYSVANDHDPHAYRKLMGGVDPLVRLVEGRWRVSMTSSPLCPPPRPNLAVEVVAEPVRQSEIAPGTANHFPLGAGDECALDDVPDHRSVLIVPGHEGVFQISRHDNDPDGVTREFQLRPVALRGDLWVMIAGETLVARPSLLVIIAALPAPPAFAASATWTPR